nr:hypothetical protein [Paenibacillus taihuensis]
MPQAIRKFAELWFVATQRMGWEEAFTTWYGCSQPLPLPKSVLNGGAYKVINLSFGRSKPRKNYAELAARRDHQLSSLPMDERHDRRSAQPH